VTAGEDMSEFYQLRFATILAKSERNASSELTALFASKQDDGIDDKIELSGNKLKNP
jgi:hypothetical protein